MMNIKTLWKDLLFVHRYILEEKTIGYICCSFLFFLFAIAENILQTVLPAFVVFELKRAVSFRDLIAHVGAFFIVLAVISLFAKTIDRYLFDFVDMKRLFKGGDYYNHMMKMDFEQLTNPSKQKEIDAGLDSYMDDYHIGFTHFISDSRTLFVSVGTFVVYLILSERLHPVILFVILIGAVFSSVLSQILFSWQKENQSILHTSNANFHHYVRETSKTKNQKEIRLFKLTDLFSKKISEEIDRQMDWYQKEEHILLVVSFFKRLLFFIKTFVLYFLLIHVSQQSNSIPLFLYLSSLSFGADLALQKVMEQFDFLRKNHRFVMNTKKILQLPVEDSRSAAEPLTFAGDIVFDHVHFHYENQATNALDDLSVRISPGEHIAIVGENGSGKTTFISLLLRLYRPTSGTISIGEKNILTFPLSSYREKFTTVFQEMNIFAFSLLENISLRTKEETNSVRVREMLEKAKISSNILSLSFDTPLTKEFDDNGIVLSGGNAQKLMMARCFYHAKEMVILDEPSSQLDALSEERLYALYRKQLRGKTTFFISHRLASTQFCDRILFFRQGKIIEDGTHDELMAKKGNYYHMFELQAKEYREDLHA